MSALHCMRTVVVPLATDSSVNPVVLGGLTLVMLVGLAFLGAGTLSLSRWWHLRQAEANEFRGRLDGPVEIAGQARPASDSDSFHAAVSDTECLVSEIEAQRRNNNGQGSSHWASDEFRTTTRPFLVDSPVGTVRVEPEGADFVLEQSIVDELGGGEEATGRTAAFFDAVGIDRSPGSVDIGVTELDYGSRYRVREGRVDVGERIYVAGHAETNVDATAGFDSPDAVIREQTDSSLRQRLFGHPFVIGDEGEQTVRRHFLKSGAGLSAFGLAVVAIVVWLLVGPLL